MLKYCAYQGCNNKYLPCSKLTFFSLPKDYRRRIWIENSGNPLLQNISPNSARQFCEKHFDPSFLRRQFNRTILHRNAIPYKYDSEELGEDNSKEYLVNQLEIESSIYVSSEDNDNEQRLDIEAPSTTCNAEDVENGSDDGEVIEAYRVIYDVESPETEQIVTEDNSQTHQHHPYITDYSEDEQESNADKREISSSNINAIELAYDKSMISSANTNGKEIPSHKRSAPSFKSEDEISCDDRKNISSSTKMETTNKRLKIRSEDDPEEPRSDRTGSGSEYEEDKHFALSLVGYFQRLPLRKRSIAKLKILQYLTELQYSDSLDINL